MKIRTLLVDDEPLITNSLAALITQFDADFEIVGMAANGADALSLVHSASPDLVILDISMPVMSGTEVMEKLRQLGFPGRIIVLSAYREFEYAQAALRAGASEYLLKPFDRKRLREVLAATKAELAEARQNSTMQEKSTRYQLAKQLAALFQQPAALEKNYPGLAKRYGLPTASFLLLGIGNLKCASVSELNTLVDQCNEFLLAWHGVCCAAFSENLFCLLPLHAETESTIQQFFAFLRAQRGGSVMLCLSSAIQSPAALAREYQLVSHDLKLLFYRYDMPPIFERRRVPGVPSFQAAPISLDAFIIAVQNKQEQEALRFAEQLFLSTDARRDIDPEQLYSAAYDMTVILRAAPFQQSERSRLHLTSVTLDSLHQYYNIEDLFYFLYSSILLCFESLQVPEDEDVVIRRAKQFCSKHYGDNIGLQEVADYVNMSKTYFSSYFKAHTGCTFLAYLTHLRLDVAKYRLTHTNEKIVDIARAVGYHNTSHFIRLFREELHMTPQEYRSSIL